MSSKMIANTYFLATLTIMDTKIGSTPYLVLHGIDLKLQVGSLDLH